MTQYHLGMNLGHERSVAIVQDGQILVAIEQERLDRQKYSPGYMLHSPGVATQIQLPHEAIRYCLDTCNITLNDLATITANMPGQDYAPDILRRTLPAEVASQVMKLPSHHLAHAYSAYFPSGFTEALILVADASGSTVDHRTESYTLYEGRGQTLSTLHSETVTAHLAGLSTLGFVYEYITRKAGFVSTLSDKIKHAEAGKLMGLAPFGGAQPNFHRWIQTIEDSFSLKISAYDIFLEVAALEKRYDDGSGKPYLRPYLVDMAYKIQQELEQALLHIVRLAIKQTGLRCLCIAGGVGLNSVANYQLLHQLNLEDIFIFPAAGDSGIAVGSALWAYHATGGQKRVPLTKANLGRSYNNDQVRQSLQQFQGDVVVEELTSEQMIVRSAQALAKGNVVARFEGGAEYGPRALGQRSIMADPTFLRMKDIVNARVKFREAFRPFAPVIPLESISQVFEQEVAAPFMLVVPQIKPEFQALIPAVTHVDGTGRVQTVTAGANPYFYRLCHQLVQERQGPPVLLNTSFNVAGQPIVETPVEAISTFLSTDIDYLAIENFWVSKRHVPVLDYDQHLDKVGDCVLPHGLLADAPAVTTLMAQLDRALFFGETSGCPWSPSELQVLSAQGGQYKETSVLFPEAPFHGTWRTQLSDRIVLLLDPLGKSTLVDLTQQTKPTAYSFEQVKLLLAMLNANGLELEQMRIQWHLTPFEFLQKIDWATQQLATYGLQPQHSYPQLPLPDSPLPLATSTTFAPFEQECFSARQQLQQLHTCLSQAGYTNANMCQLLGVESQQQIEPTRLHYYDRYHLPVSPLGDLIRLFQCRVALSEERLQALFGSTLFSVLCQLGLLIRRDQHWASRVDLFDADGLYIATDHRYMILPEDAIAEDPVMYLGMDSMGLVHTAPRVSVGRVLDLCCGSGIQGLTATRYAGEVVGVDINPRAIRFSRFNAQLNGIDNIQFRLGNLYQVALGRFDTILANPPFVPSPRQEFRFRDGGANGEEILAQIIAESANHLVPNGRLFIVTDLVDVPRYESKLENWWQGGTAHKLVLCTADRNDILFSVPHSHAPFDQTFEQYNAELEQWLHNFHAAELTAVNFGYILICRTHETDSGSYYTRTIHNPSRSIYAQVQTYFQQRQLLTSVESLTYRLALSSDIHFRVEIHPSQGTPQVELFSRDNPYFTTYPISEQVYALLQEIVQCQPQMATCATAKNQSCLYDLICKGIVCLTPEGSCGSRAPLTGGSKFGIVEYPAEHAPRQLDDPAAGDMSIAELQTKTTPTCLSSYLR
jgi:carbamoyltransferase